MTIMLLEWVFTSVFLILVVLALRAALGRRMSAGLRYALWAVVLVRLLVPVQLFTSPIAGTWVITEERTEYSVSPPASRGENALPRADGPTAVVNTAPSGNGPVLTAPNAPTLPDAPSAPQPPAAPDLTKAPAWLGWTWLAGSAVMAGVFLLSNLRFVRRLRRCRIPMEGTDCPRPVYAAVGLPSPCLFGVLRPAVYVTPEAAADPAMLRHVLAHEYTHFRHGDHIWSLLRCAALAIHWWNPLVWLAVSLSRRDGELACDEGAIKRLGDGERLAYGSTLLALVTARPRPGDLLCFATTMAGDKRSLKERFTRIAQAPKRWLWAAVAAVLVTALACGCAFGQKADTAGDSDLWPDGVSEMNYVRDAGGFGGDFAITLNRDGTFSYCAGYLSSYIGTGTWTREGDVICLADEGLRGSAGIQRYYFRMEGGCLVFQAENSAEFMYVDVADGERFSQRSLESDVEVEIAFDHAGNSLQSSFFVPDEMLDAAKAWVGRRFAWEAPDGTMTPSWGEYNEETGRWDMVEDPDPDHAARFDRVRISYMDGPWGYPEGETDYSIWCINFEYHTTTPEQAENLLVGGRYLTEDDWFCPTYSYSTYLIFKGSELAAATLINDCGPYDGSGRFYTAIAQALGQEAEEPSDHEELLALFPADTEDVPEDVLHFVAKAVQERYGQYYDYLRQAGSSICFDGCRVQALNGPWRGAAHDMDLEVWQLNYEFHTTTPQAAQDLLVGGNYLTEDNWLCPVYPNCTYAVFVVNDVGKLGYLTDFTATDPSPEGDAGQFFDYVGLILAQRRLVDANALAPDLDRDGAPESLTLSEIEMGQRLEVQKDGRTIWAEEGYSAHTGYNALFLCTLEGQDYLLRYHPYMSNGWCTYHYRLFTLSPKGEEQVVRENQVDFDLNFQPSVHQSFDIDAIAAFMDEINELLSHSVQLLNTDENLLSTFEKEGQLVDTLAWLDWWVPLYEPTHRDRWSLRGSLQEFEQVMGRDRYSHTLEVQAVNEAGTDLRISYKDRYASFTGSWDYQYQGGADPQVADLNQDGRDEIVVILYTPRHGTGVMIQELHVFDADTLEEYDCSSLTETLIGQVSSTGDGENFYLTAPGAGHVTIPKTMAARPADVIHLGDYVEYCFQDNTLTCRLGCDMGMLEYCGEIRAKLDIDPATGKITPSSFWYAPHYTAAGSLSAGQSQAYRMALLGESELLLALEGEERTPVNIGDVPALFDPDSGYARVGRFTVLDLDGVGGPEVVLQVASVSGDMGGYVILHQEDGQVLGLPMGYRSFTGLKTDGTFEYTDPTGVTSGGISSIQIKWGFYVIDDLAMWAAPSPGEDVDSYWVNHQEATEAQYRAVQAIQDDKPYAVWHDFTPENINTVFP